MGYFRGISGVIWVLQKYRIIRCIERLRGKVRQIIKGKADYYGIGSGLEQRSSYELGLGLTRVRFRVQISLGIRAKVRVRFRIRVVRVHSSLICYLVVASTYRTATTFLGSGSGLIKVKAAHRKVKAFHISSVSYGDIPHSGVG